MFRAFFAKSGFIALACSVSFAALANTNTLNHFDLPAGDLAAALKSLAAQVDVELVFQPEQVRGIHTTGLKGNYSAPEAVAILLKGTRLEVKTDASGAMVIAPKGDADNRLSSAARSSLRLAEANMSPQESSPPANAGPANPDEAVDEVLVTGSRIRRSVLDNPVPVTVLDAQDIQGMGFGNVADVLQRLPALGVGSSPTNFTLGSEIGAHYANLRGLGEGRTLTLVNGRRRVAGGGGSSAVDLSSIPATMIERIEVITGGASAVYGADAVSGVLNIILKQDFNGLAFDVRASKPGFDHAENYSVGLFGGTPFAEGRGSLSFAVNRTKDDLVGNHQVPWLDRRGYPFFVSNPDNTGPNDGIADFINIANGRVRPLHYAGAFNVNGSLYTVDPGLRLIENDRIISGIGVGGDGGDPNDWNTFRAGSESLSVLGSLRYQINEAVRLTLDADFTNAEASAPWAADLYFGMPVLRDNPYVPADLAALMDANGLTQVSVSKMFIDNGLRVDSGKRNTYTVVTGLDGRLGDRWDWQAFYQYGQYDRRSRGEGYSIRSRFFEAIDVILDPETHSPVCRSESARENGCQPVNVLGRGAASPDALAYFQHTIIRDLINKQSVAGVQLSGDLFSLPAGAVKLASGLEYRDESLSIRDDGALVLGLVNQGTGSDPIDAGFNVSEAFAEVLMPLLADKPFAKRLDLESAVRLSHYNTIGDTTTWKIGATWGPVEDIRLRAMRSHSVRAPNLIELFSPGVSGFGTDYDPCSAPNIDLGSSSRVANCRAAGVPEGWVTPRMINANTLTGGNPDLDPETSNSWTIGAVLVPRSVPNFSLSIDYWKIELEKAIESIDSFTIVTRCYDSPSLDNPFCPLFNRGTALDPHEISVINVTNVNIGRLSTDGIDFSAGYAFDVSRWGRGGQLSLSLAGTHVRSFEQQVDSSDPSTLLVSTGEVQYPKWRGSLGVAYDRDALGLTLMTRYVGSSRFDVQAPRELYDPSGAGSRIYNDLLGRMRFGEHSEAFIGVNNVFGVKPPYTPNTFSGRPSGFYDLMGRMFFAGVTLRL